MAKAAEATKAGDGGVAEAGQQVGDQAKGRRDRSPNYPGLTFGEALEKAKLLWDKDKKHPMLPDVAARHLGYTNAKNGAFGTVISSLRKYGLVESSGNDLRVSDDANSVFVYPDTAPERRAIMRKLAMRPPIFNEVLTKYPGGLPSDDNLRAKLQIDWSFASAGAADTFIRALRSAMSFAAVDQPEQEPNNSDVDPESEADVMTINSQDVNASRSGRQPPGAHVTPAALPAGARSWDLGGGSSMIVSVPAKLTKTNIQKLKRYVAALEMEASITWDDEEESSSS